MPIAAFWLLIGILFEVDCSKMKFRFFFRQDRQTAVTDNPQLFGWNVCFQAATPVIGMHTPRCYPGHMTTPLPHKGCASTPYAIGGQHKWHTHDTKRVISPGGIFVIFLWLKGSWWFPPPADPPLSITFLHSLPQCCGSVRGLWLFHVLHAPRGQPPMLCEPVSKATFHSCCPPPMCLSLRPPPQRFCPLHTILHIVYVMDIISNPHT